MRQLLDTLLKIPECRSLVSAIDSGDFPAAVTGLAPIHRAQIAAVMACATGRPLVMVCTDEAEANRLGGDLQVLLGETPGQLFARELFVRAGTVISRQWEYARISTLYELSRGQCRLLVTTCEGLLQKTSPAAQLQEAVLTLEVGSCYDLSRLPQQLL